MSAKVKFWDCLDTRVVHETRVFNLIVRRMRSPLGRYEGDFYALESADWVNVIPVTDDNRVVLIEQFRHGIQDVSIEIPGGLLDERESPLHAARRELEEETGFTATEFSSLGFVYPNPAIQGNKCHLFVAHGARETRKQNLDPAEDIAVVLVPLDEIMPMIRRHEITHSMAVVAFLRYFAEKYRAFIP